MDTTRGRGYKEESDDHVIRAYKQHSAYIGTQLYNLIIKIQTLCASRCRFHPPHRTVPPRPRPLRCLYSLRGYGREKWKAAIPLQVISALIPTTSAGSFTSPAKKAEATGVPMLDLEDEGPAKWVYSAI